MLKRPTLKVTKLFYYSSASLPPCLPPSPLPRLQVVVSFRPYIINSLSPPWLALADHARTMRRAGERVTC